MDQDKTTGNQANTEDDGYGPVDREILGRLTQLQAEAEDAVKYTEDRCDQLEKRLDHLDLIAHGMDQKLTAISALLEEHRPLLDRYARLANSGKAARAALGFSRPSHPPKG